MSQPMIIDPSSDAPLRRQVYEHLRTAILTGDLPPGERLPATRHLAEELDVARSTVAEAYGQLRVEGYVRGRRGSGTYVSPDLPSERRLPGDARSSRPRIRLSGWGERVAARASSPHEFTPRYDFRPHRSAQDHFPWAAWRASVEEALLNERAELLSYPPPGGHEGLRGAIASHVACYRSVRCSPDRVVIVNGTQQGLNLLAQLVLEPDDRVVVEDPGYPAAREALAARGLEVARVPVDPEGLVVTELPPARLIHVTASHQDPTGVTLSLGRRLALLERAAQDDAIVLEDDYDSEFRYEGQPVESLQGLDRTGRVVYAGTFSKSLLPGLRIGFVVLPPDLVGAFIAAKSLWDGGTSLLDQAALAHFLRSGEYERHIRRLRRIYHQRRDVLISALEEAFGNRVEVGAREGGLNVLVRLRIGMTGAELCARAEKAGIGLRSADRYYARPPEESTLLMGFAGMNEEGILAGVRELRRLAL